MMHGHPHYRLKLLVWLRCMGDMSLRASGYRVFAECPNLVVDLQTDAMSIVF